MIRILIQWLFALVPFIRIGGGRIVAIVSRRCAVDRGGPLQGGLEVERLQAEFPGGS